MNFNPDHEATPVSAYQARELQRLMTRLFLCCQERMQYQSERFELPDAELRCLTHFGEERYLTPKGLAQKMNVAKSRVSKLVENLIRRGLINRLKDPVDSRIALLGLTPAGQSKLNEINSFFESIHTTILDRIGPEHRDALLTYLGLMERTLESVKEMME